MPEASAIEDLPFLDVMSPEFLSDPERGTRELRRKYRAVRTPFGVEILGFPESVEMFRDERVTQNFEKQMAMLGLPSGLAYDHMTHQLGNQEGANHHRLRKLIMPAFSTTAMERLRDAARSVFINMVDASVVDGEVEFASEVSAHYPSVVFCRFLNVPDEEAATLARINRSIFKMFWRDPANRDEIETAFQELTEFVFPLIEQRRKAPGEDFISRLIQAEEEGSRLTTDEMVDMVKVSLWAAVDNIAHTMNSMVSLFAEHPDQWEILRTRPELIPGAVEECMRLRPRFTRIPCYVSQNLELAGVHLPAGSWVSAMVVAANRDERVFPQPDRFDITRTPVSPNMNFGAGRHTCSGIHLARVQLQETLGVLVRRYLRIEITREVVYHRSLQTYGIDRLPVRFTAV
ncbi:cytochrome P450 [Nocardia sp. NPDC051929]|uniref:cytochrome P450 n=1 Tax=unclassified Nocardia TaxID=2637762 RepID=UPI003427143C